MTSSTSGSSPIGDTPRLEALRRAEILDTGREHEFDALAELAAYICRTPIAAISFIDDRRQWFKAQIGLSGPEVSRDTSFCAQVVTDDAPIVVDDARLDARFRNFATVVGDPGVRFYAGFPLHDTDGFALGSVCVVDTQPRAFDPAQRRALAAVAAQAEAQLRMRKLAADLRAALAQVKVLSGLVPMCAWCRKIRDDRQFWQDVETYLKQQAGVSVSHGICPDCLEKAE